MNTKTISVLALLLLAGTHAKAELPPLVTDRPDFTESATSLPWGHAQLELGVVAGFQSGQQDLSLPGLLARIGLGRSFELRVAAPSVSWVFAEGEEAQLQTLPMAVGAKWVHKTEAGVVGLMPMVTLPVERDQYDSVGVELAMTMIWTLDLSERLSLTGNATAGLSGLGADQGEVDWRAAASLSLGIGLTDRLGTFLELYGLFDSASAQPFAQTGVTLLVTPRLQIDLHGGVLLDDPTLGSVGCGLALLI